MEKNLSTVNQKSLSDSTPKFSVYMSSENVRAAVNNACGKNAQSFIASVVSAVSINPELQKCDQRSILSAALLGESLKLSPSPQLGQYYFVPFNDKSRGMVAQFILGYKGYIQLAIRSGQYRKLNAIAIKKGEFISYDPLMEELFVKLIQDEEEREKAETIGYFAMFEYINGFRKALYWSKEKMLIHADKYSKAFSLYGTSGKNAKRPYADYEAGKIPEDEMWKYSSFWYKDFDGMAIKTMLRQLISKWGIMSVEMERAYINDEKIIEKVDGDLVLSEDPSENTDTMQFPSNVDVGTGEIKSDPAKSDQGEGKQNDATEDDFGVDDFFSDNN